MYYYIIAKQENNSSFNKTSDLRLHQTAASSNAQKVSGFSKQFLLQTETVSLANGRLNFRKTSH